MRVGVLCQGWPLPTRREAKGWQAVVTLSLVEALTEAGADAFPVVWEAKNGSGGPALPYMDHAIVVTELARRAVLEDEAYRGALRSRVAGKVCLYVDAPIVEYEEPFDLMFTGEGWNPAIDAEFVAAHPKIIPVGFGSDPSIFRPFYLPSMKTLLISYPDPIVAKAQPGLWPLAHRVLSGLDRSEWWVLGAGVRAPGVEDVLTTHRMLERLEVDVHELEGYWIEGNLAVAEEVEAYIPRVALGPWFGGASFYLDLRGGALDLTRIDAAYAGATILVPSSLYRETMHGVLPCRQWETADDLREALAQPVDRWAVAQSARDHAWPKVALRIICALGER